MTTTTAKRAAIYARVSHDKRAGRSVSEQESESRAACSINRWDVVKVYADNDVSASRFTTRKRAEWQRLVDDLDAGRYDVLVLWEPSRGSRELMTWAALLDACRRHHVLVHVVSHLHTYDLSKPRDWRSLAEDGVDSAYESEKASQRIQRAMHANAVAGKPHGRIPYGYRRRYDESTKALVAQELDPKTAPVVSEIVQRLAKAEPVVSVTKELDSRGIPSPTGKQWTRQIVRRVGLNAAYAGQREHAGTTYEGDWPAIVDVATHLAARRVLEDPARKTTVSRPGRVKYLLSYIATCAVCGERLSAAPRSGAPTYFCPRFCVSMQAQPMDGVVLDALLDLLKQPELRLNERFAASDDLSVLDARERVATLRAKLDEWRDAAATGDVTPASLAHIESRLIGEIAEAERQSLARGGSLSVAALTMADDVEKYWDSMPLAARREAVSQLLTVQLGRASAPGRHAAKDYARVSIAVKEQS